jgi:hypothetical protein
LRSRVRSCAPSGLELLLLLGRGTPGALVREAMRPRVTLGSREGAWEAEACRACAFECEAARSGTNVSSALGHSRLHCGRSNKLGHGPGSLKHRRIHQEVPKAHPSTLLRAAPLRQEKSQLTHGHSWMDEEIVIWVDGRVISLRERQATSAIGTWTKCMDRGRQSLVPEC